MVFEVVTKPETVRAVPIHLKLFSRTEQIVLLTYHLRKVEEIEKEI